MSGNAACVERVMAALKGDEAAPRQRRMQRLQLEKTWKGWQALDLAANDDSARAIGGHDARARVPLPRVDATELEHNLIRPAKSRTLEIGSSEWASLAAEHPSLAELPFALRVYLNGDDDLVPVATLPKVQKRKLKLHPGVCSMQQPTNSHAMLMSALIHFPCS